MENQKCHNLGYLKFSEEYSGTIWHLVYFLSPFKHFWNAVLLKQIWRLLSPFPCLYDVPTPFPFPKSRSRTGLSILSYLTISPVFAGTRSSNKLHKDRVQCSQQRIRSDKARKETSILIGSDTSHDTICRVDPDFELLAITVLSSLVRWKRYRVIWKCVGMVEKIGKIEKQPSEWL